jgi:hypothetical protein
MSAIASLARVNHRLTDYQRALGMPHAGEYLNQVQRRHHLKGFPDSCPADSKLFDELVLRG